MSAVRQEWTAAGVLLLIVLAITAVALLPFALVASLNTLFELGIGYDFRSWLSALFLLAIVAGRSRQ